jgi:flavin-dependent dehydrogenase
MTPDTDVIIIGAGPAGLMAARRLEELDISYTLVSRDSTPGIDKACGGYVPSYPVVPLKNSTWERYLDQFLSIPFG